MFLLQKSNRKVSSRSQIGIEGVRDGVLMLPNNHYRVILQSSSVNFELKSEEEQDALIETYQSFLHSLGYPVQIVVRIRELDMDKYLLELKQRLVGEKQKIYRSQLQSYARFVSGLVTHNKILTRYFYVVVPYSPKHRHDFGMAKEELDIRCDIVSRGLLRLGIHTRPLTSLEILDLFYTFYNPEAAKRQPITNQTLQLLHSLFIQKEPAHD